MTERSFTTRTTEPVTRDDWARLLGRSRVRPSKAMGQNFLVEPDIVAMIADAAGVTAGSRAIEIGPGLGILTRELLRRGSVVTGVELDDELASLLEGELGDRPGFDLVRADGRHVDIGRIVGDAPYMVVANLPYSVATVIIRHFVESPTPPTALTVMVQKEVAERMTATAGDMSLLGIATQLYTEADIAFVVPPEAFLPPPKVESAVLTMRVRDHLPSNQATRDRLFELATMAFQRKRKTLANGLANGLARPKAEIEAALNAIGIDPMRRPQTLDVADWLAVAAALPS